MVSPIKLFWKYHSLPLPLWYDNMAGEITWNPSAPSVWSLKFQLTFAAKLDLKVLLMSSILINLRVEKAYSQLVSSPVTALSWKMGPNWPNKNLLASSIFQESTCLKILTRSTFVIVNTITLTGVQNGQIRSVICDIFTVITMFKDEHHQPKYWKVE